MPPLLMLIITFPLQSDSGARAARNFRFFSSLAFLLRSGYKPLTVLAAARCQAETGREPEQCAAKSSSATLLSCNFAARDSVRSDL